VIVVVGRPGLDASDNLDRPAALIALAAAEAGAKAGVVGAVGDDADGEHVALALGKAGLGHAALLRDPSAQTPRVGRPGGSLPRLDGQDVELGLAYLTEYRVLVVAEPLDAGAVEAAAAAASFQGAALVVVLSSGGVPPGRLPATATVLEMPDEDEGAFAQLVGRYAAALDAGQAPADAWQRAIDAGGWQAAAEQASE
jgi:hypothetical protein